MKLDDAARDEMASHAALQRLLAAYADCVNRHAWSELPALFLTDARIELVPLKRPPIELTGPEALGRFIAGAIERFDFFEFVVLNARFSLRLDQDSARGRLFMCEYRRERATTNWTQVFGIYHDRYRRIDGRWVFEHRRFDPLASQGSDNVVFEHSARLRALLDEAF
ncbi:MAG: nuclear transport factor 2 family protein [Holophagales bacterium]|nr:nuclear transport factor 2 family protein [Holophagales bacterium]